MKSLQQSLNEAFIMNEASSAVRKYRQYETNPPVWFKDYKKLYKDKYGNAFNNDNSVFSYVIKHDIESILKVGEMNLHAKCYGKFALMGKAEDWISKQIKAYVNEYIDLDGVPVSVIAGMLDDYINTQKDWEFIANWCPFLCPKDAYGSHINFTLSDNIVYVTFNNKISYNNITIAKGTDDITTQKNVLAAVEILFGDNAKYVIQK